MAKVIKKACVSTGEYTTRDGVVKTRWLEVGRIMQSDKGGKFLLLDRSFNPSGVPFDPKYNTIMISLFDVKEDDSKQPEKTQNQTAQDFYDEDVPF